MGTMRLSRTMHASQWDMEMLGDSRGPSCNYQQGPALTSWLGTPSTPPPQRGTHGDGDTSVVVDGGGGEEDVTDGGALGPKPARRARGDDEVRVEGLQCQVSGERGRHGTDVVHAVLSTLAVHHDVHTGAGVGARVRDAGSGLRDDAGRVLC